MSLTRDRDRGVRAKQLLENELFNECFDSQISDIHKVWESPSIDEKERERLWYMLQGIRGAKEYLERLVATGKHSEKELKKQIKD